MILKRKSSASLICAIPLIPDLFLAADRLHRVLEQGAALNFHCGRYSSSTGKYKTGARLRVSLWACETGHTADSKGNVKLDMPCCTSTSLKKTPQLHTDKCKGSYNSRWGALAIRTLFCLQNPAGLFPLLCRSPCSCYMCLQCLVALDGSFTQLDSKVNIWYFVTFETMFPWTYQRAWSDYLTLLVLYLIIIFSQWAV